MKKENHTFKPLVNVLMISLIFFVVLLFSINLAIQLNLLFNKTKIIKQVAHTSSVLATEDTKEILLDVPRRTTAPKTVRGIYLTAYSASRKEWIDRLIEKIKNGGGINSVVIDIKDYTGYVLYNSNLENLKQLKLIKAQVEDIEEVIKRFHEANIYVIARLTVFQDPALAKAQPELALKKYNGETWYNYNGLAFTDPQKKEVWEHNVEIAKEAVSLGFDEINFDYMRYPSDGNLKTINYNIPEGKLRAEVLEDFYKYLSDELSATTNTSIDLFGMVMDNVDTEYDLGIGQRLLNTQDYFDYICPMMYPSHYPNNYLGLGNPAANPGPVISFGIKKAAYSFEGKRATLRPWLQAFNIGAVYNKSLIDAQTIAVETASSTSGWLLWNARNYYEDHIFLK